jgi:hypothetical protein
MTVIWWCRSIKVFHAKFWISNTGKLFLPFIRLMSQIRTNLSVTHQHSSRRIDNCILSHKMKQDEKHHLILFLMDVPKQQFAHLLKIMTISEANASILSKHKHLIRMFVFNQRFIPHLGYKNQFTRHSGCRLENKWVKGFLFLTTVFFSLRQCWSFGDQSSYEVFVLWQDTCICFWDGHDL